MWDPAGTPALCTFSLQLCLPEAQGRKYCMTFFRQPQPGYKQALCITASIVDAGLRIEVADTHASATESCLHL